MQWTSIRKVIVLIFLLVVLWGCDQENKNEKTETTFEIEKEYKRGPVVYTLKASQQEITIADHLQLAIEVEVQEGYQVRLPEFGEKLEQFGIVDYRVPLPKLIENGVTLYQKMYELEPFLSGKYKIPPMKIIFWKQEEANEKKHEVESEELTITVKSLLPENAANLTIKEIAPPMAPPSPDHRWLFGIMGVSVLGIGSIAAFFVWHTRRKKREVVIERTAHEIAYEALDALLAENLIEQAEIKTFYLRLSNILRHYIENRFALSAPEQTTEEFLDELRRTNTLIPKHKDLLKKFLEHCDMVKFARHDPSNEEIQQTFDACKQFIAETEASLETETPQKQEDRKIVSQTSSKGVVSNAV